MNGDQSPRLAPFLIALTKPLTKELKEGEVYFGSCFMFAVHHVGKGTASEQEDNRTEPGSRQLHAAA